MGRMFWQWVLGIVMLGWIMFSGARFPQAWEFSQSIFNICGILLLFCGILGRIYATLYIGGMKNIGNDGKSFVRDGIYRATRNPLYFFSFVALLGLLCFKGQITLIIVGAIAFLLIYRATILGEERFLREKFGAPYEDFLSTTPRFFPRFRDFSYSQKLEIQPLFLHKEIKRAFVWILGAFAIYAITLLQDSGILPVLVSVY